MISFDYEELLKIYILFFNNIEYYFEILIKYIFFKYFWIDYIIFCLSLFLTKEPNRYFFHIFLRFLLIKYFLPVIILLSVSYYSLFFNMIFLTFYINILNFYYIIILFY